MTSPVVTPRALQAAIVEIISQELPGFTVVLVDHKARAISRYTGNRYDLGVICSITHRDHGWLGGIWLEQNILQWHCHRLAADFQTDLCDPACWTQLGDTINRTICQGC